MNNHYDETKKMLNTLRKLNESAISKKPMIKEQEDFDAFAQKPKSDIKPLPGEEVEDKNNITVINDVDVKIITTDDMDVEIREDQKTAISGAIDQFRSQVSQIAEFEPGFTVEDDQIRLDGSIPDMDINFVFIAGEEKGLYINSEMLKIDDESLEALEKLSKFEITFVTTLEPIIRDRKNN